jgi:UDP-N-acetylmuramate--alanine ligase
MKELNDLQQLDTQRDIHFIGVGGCGMSGVALAMRRMGFVISGSDMSESETTEKLRSAGINVAIGHNGGNIPASAQLVVMSAAVKPDNAEYMAGQARGIPIIKYARMLGVLMRSKNGIAVAGTHGKTTTTAMVALALREMGADPSFVIGGDVPQLGGGSGVGSSDYLVAEACEYDRSFLNLYPRHAIINNIEEDHLDYYKDLDEIVEAFREFALRLPEDGLLVYSVSSPNIARFIRELKCRTVSCGLEAEADYQARDIRLENGRTFYRLETVADGEKLSVEVELATFGRHNVVNSLSAIALLHRLGFTLDEAARGVGAFQGVRRRFETVYDRDGITIVDDYAHHPTEIRTVLRSSRLFFEKRRIITVFQPHQHSRTRFLLRDFARSFQFSDLVVIPDIYFVRDSEQERKMVHARDLVRAILEKGGNAIYIPAFGEIEQFLANNLNPGDVLITMGAGNIWQVGRKLAEQLAERGTA